MTHKLKIKDVVDGSWEYACGKPVVGLDLGSRGSKGVLLTETDIVTAFIPTGLFMQETADELLGKLLEASGLRRSDLGFIVSTGYGRISLQFDDIPYDVVTEISCHAMGGHAVLPSTRTIIDIGGQDSKAIKVDPRSGKVLEFVMNDKCAAGTGRFLEKAATLLGLDLEQMGKAALDSISPVSISSQCVVFAESEMISLRAKGARNNDKEATTNIAAGIHYSAARRVRNLLGRIGSDPDIVFTGGVSKNPGMRKVLEELIGVPFATSKFDLMYAGALGAAVYATRYASDTNRVSGVRAAGSGADVDTIRTLIGDREKEFIEADDGKKKVGYFCAYTPIEILSAAGVRHARLFKAGKPETVAAGEALTQSVFCDFSKSCLGGFMPGPGSEPLYRSLDKVYNFHTCASMKRVSEVLGEYVPTTLLNLPKLRNNADSREYFRNELAFFARELETLSGIPFDEARLRDRIAQYNKARSIIRDISALRKRQRPPISGSDFLELVKGFYFLEPETLIPAYEELYARLSAEPDEKQDKPRVMIAGSIVADGDRRLLNILERELGLDVVAEDHCAGLKPVFNEIRETGDPFLALADAYLEQAPCAHMKPLDDSFEFSRRIVDEYRPDGIVYVYQKFCGCYGVGKKLFTDHFQSIGVPVLDISGDYSENDEGQIKTRLEAFLEVLQTQRSKKHEHAVYA